MHIRPDNIPGDFNLSSIIVKMDYANTLVEDVSRLGKPVPWIWAPCQGKNMLFPGGWACAECVDKGEALKPAPFEGSFDESGV